MANTPGSILIIDETGAQRPVLTSGDITINPRGGVTASGDFVRSVSLSRSGGTVSGSETITGGAGGVAGLVDLAAGKGIRLEGDAKSGRVTISADKPARDRSSLFCQSQTFTYTDPCFDLGLAPDRPRTSSFAEEIPRGCVVEALTVETVHPFQTLDGVIPLRVWFRLCGSVLVTSGHYEEGHTLREATAGDVLRAPMITVSRTHLVCDAPERPEIVIRGATNHRRSPGRLFSGECKVSIFFRVL